MKKKSFLGQPLGLSSISAITLCRGFANYAVSSILIYYLYKKTSEGGLGFDPNTAAQLTTVYMTLTLIAGILGGYIADRFIGLQKAVLFGNIFLTIGWTLLAIPNGGVALYVFSQVVLLMGYASMGSSINALAGKLYTKDDPRRDSGFGIMYVLNNIGAASPVISGAIALAFNYHAAFFMAAVLEGIGTLIYALTRKRVFGEIALKPDDPFPTDKKRKYIATFSIALIVVLLALVGAFSIGLLTPTSFSNDISVISIFLPFAYMLWIYRSKKTNKQEQSRVKAFLVLFIGVSFTMMVWSQSTSILAIYAEKRVDLHILGFQFSPAAFQTVPAILAVIFGTFISWLWTKLKQRQPSTAVKFGIGILLYGLGTIFMAIPFTLFDASVKVSPLWLVCFYVFIIMGEAIVSPLGYSTTSKLAPLAFSAQMMTIWQLTGATGSGISTLVINFYHEGHEAIYFILIGGITAVAGLIIWLLKKPLNTLMSK